MQWEGQDEASLRRHWQVELARRSGMSGIDMKERAFGLVLGLGPETGDRVKSRETKRQGGDCGGKGSFLDQRLHIPSACC